jgi:predicted nuclease of restriction endonuclease-like (RecB) superfamily
MQKITDMKAREYYIKATIELGWSRNVLDHQIKAMAYERHMSIEKQNNFEEVLPAHLVEQADLAMKDSYMLDFLGIKKPIVEAHLEQHMVLKIKQVIMELGFGFAFMGNQYRVKTPSNDYFIDLLFYNRYLKCLVAVELKIGAFKPEYAGKMNFYLNLLDDFVRAKDDNPSMGIILCTARDRFEVEYALRGLNKPVGISEYQLTKDLPSELADKLPSAKVLADELGAVMQMELFTEDA